MYRRQVTGLTPGDLIEVIDEVRRNSSQTAYISAENLGTALQALGMAPMAGTGSPEGVKAAPPGITYLQIDGRVFWVKETGTGNTGWIKLIE